jgi:hypothetical protein
MKLADIEDSGTLATKQDLALMAERLEKLIHKEMVGSTRWAIGVMGGVMLAFAGLILGGVYFMLSTMLAHWKP